VADEAITFKMLTADRDWLMARATAEGISLGALVRRLISQYRATIDPTDTTQTTTPTENTVPRPKSADAWNTPVAAKPRTGKKGQRYSANNPMPLSARKTPEKTTCPACQQECWANSEGNPRPHLRDARPSDLGYSELVPTKVACDE
jgi:hypothetical protein